MSMSKLNKRKTRYIYVYASTCIIIHSILIIIISRLFKPIWLLIRLTQDVTE